MRRGTNQPKDGTLVEFVVTFVAFALWIFGFAGLADYFLGHGND